MTKIINLTNAPLTVSLPTIKEKSVDVSSQIATAYLPNNAASVTDQAITSAITTLTSTVAQTLSDFEAESQVDYQAEPIVINIDGDTPISEIIRFDQLFYQRYDNIVSVADVLGISIVQGVKSEVVNSNDAFYAILDKTTIEVLSLYDSISFDFGKELSDTVVIQEHFSIQFNKPITDSASTTDSTTITFGKALSDTSIASDTITMSVTVNKGDIVEHVEKLYLHFVKGVISDSSSGSDNLSIVHTVAAGQDYTVDDTYFAEDFVRLPPYDDTYDNL